MSCDFVKNTIFVNGATGEYSFNSAIFRVSHDNTLSKAEAPVKIVTLVRVAHGHELFDYSRPNTCIHHSAVLKGKMPEFFGEWAGDELAMWEYLSGIVLGHLKQTKESPAFAS